MRKRSDGTCRENQAFRDDMTNVQSFFGVRWWQLERETEALGDYLRGPWMDTGDLEDILSEYFPGMTLFSKKEMAKRAGYSDWRSMERAITGCGSLVHFLQDGPIWATAPSSFDVGMAKVVERGAKREAANYFTAVNSYGPR